MIKLSHQILILSHIYDIWHTLFDTLWCGLWHTNKITCIVHLHVNKFLMAPGIGWMGWVHIANAAFRKIEGMCYTTTTVSQRFQWAGVVSCDFFINWCLVLCRCLRCSTFHKKTCWQKMSWFWTLKLVFMFGSVSTPARMQNSRHSTLGRYLLPNPWIPSTFPYHLHVL